MPKPVAERKATNCYSNSSERSQHSPVQIDPSDSPGGTNMHRHRQHRCLGPRECQHGISIGSAVFVGLTVETNTDKQTDRAASDNACIGMGSIYSMLCIQRSLKCPVKALSAFFLTMRFTIVNALAC